MGFVIFVRSEPAGDRGSDSPASTMTAARQLPSLAHADAGRGTAPRRRRDLTPMALSLCVGFCALPFVFLLVTPWLGFRTALGTALVVLGGVTIVCWALCATGRHVPR